MRKCSSCSKPQHITDVLHVTLRTENVRKQFCSQMLNLLPINSNICEKTTPLPLLRDGIYSAASKQSVLPVDLLGAGKMARRKDLSNFHKGQIVLAKRLGQNISKKVGLLVLSSRPMQWLFLPKVVQGRIVNTLDTRSWLIDAHGK